MADRETIKLTTKSGQHTAELVTYFTRRERREIKNALFGDKELQVDGKSDVKASVNMAATDAAEDATIRVGVLQLDGSADNVVERFLDLPDEEADEIKAKLDEATGGADNEKKDVGPANTKG